MTFRTLAIAANVLNSIEAAVRDGHPIDAGVLGSFNSGVQHLLLSGREPADIEIQALHQLAAGIFVKAEEEAEEVKQEVEPEPQPEPAPEPQQVAEDPSSERPLASGAAGEGQPSEAEVTQPEPSSEGPADPVTNEPAPEAEVLQPPEVPAKLPEEAAAEAVETNTFNADAFQEQPHDENDAT